MTIGTCNPNRALVRMLEDANRVKYTIQHKPRLIGSEFETFSSEVELRCFHLTSRKRIGTAQAVESSVIRQLGETGTEGTG